METAARQLGVDPAELRRQNFIQEFPYQTPVIMAYDTGDFGASLDNALSASDYAGFAARKAEAASRGKKRGIGLSCYIEACGIAPSAAVGSLGAGVGLWESGEVRVNPVGTVEILTGSHSHGQGHETTFASWWRTVLACQLTMSRLFTAIPTRYSSAWEPMVRAPVLSHVGNFQGTRQGRGKGKKIAAHLLEAADTDIVIEDGEVKVAGTDKKLGWHEVCLAAYTGPQFAGRYGTWIEGRGFL